MCRFTVYKGRRMLIGDVLVRPENSLIHQSRDAAYHPGVDDKTHERNIIVNADGFGVSWYGDVLERGSCCFKFVTPAWSNINLRNIGDHVASHLIFGHVRAASSGHDPHEKTIVSTENAHPFVYKRYTFMHNGGVPHFNKIKLALLNLLSPEIFADISGTTDSEHLFALFLQYLPSRDAVATLDEIVNALTSVISTAIGLCSRAGIADPSSFNFCLSDGVNIIATRFRNGEDCPPSLYYNYGSDFVCEDGRFFARGTQRSGIAPSAVVISSAPLSEVQPDHDSDREIGELPYAEKGLDGYYIPARPAEACSGGAAGLPKHVGDWLLVPKNHMIICRGNESAMDYVTGVQVTPIVLPAPMLHSPHIDTKGESSISTNLSDWSLPKSSSNSVSSSEDRTIVLDGTGARRKPRSGAAGLAQRKARQRSVRFRQSLQGMSTSVGAKKASEPTAGALLRTAGVERKREGEDQREGESRSSRQALDSGQQGRLRGDEPAAAGDRHQLHWTHRRVGGGSKTRMMRFKCKL